MQKNNFSVYVLLSSADADVFESNKKWLCVVMAYKTQKSGISPEHIQRGFWSRSCGVLRLAAPILERFRGGLTFSTTAAPLSDMAHTPSSSQQEKTQGSEISF